MTYTGQAVLAKIHEIVEALNAQADARLGAQCARFEGNATYLAIRWGDILLWNSDGDHLADRAYLEHEDPHIEREPNLRHCWLVVHHEGAAMAECARSGLENLGCADEVV
jgi:hypothetical protein